MPLRRNGFRFDTPLAVDVLIYVLNNNQLISWEIKSFQGRLTSGAFLGVQKQSTTCGSTALEGNTQQPGTMGYGGLQLLALLCIELSPLVQNLPKLVCRHICVVYCVCSHVHYVFCCTQVVQRYDRMKKGWHWLWREGGCIWKWQWRWRYALLDSQQNKLLRPNKLPMKQNSGGHTTGWLMPACANKKDPLL